MNNLSAFSFECYVYGGPDDSPGWDIEFIVSVGYSKDAAMRNLLTDDQVSDVIGFDEIVPLWSDDYDGRTRAKY